jgi:hypothetical protein
MVDNVTSAFAPPTWLQGDIDKVKEVQVDAFKEVQKDFEEDYKDFDRSFESPDVAKHPEKYTAEQKFVYLMDLYQSKANYAQYLEAVYQHRVSHGADPSKEDHQALAKNYILTGREIDADFDKAITAMENDPEVQAFISTLVTANIQEILASGTPSSQALLMILKNDFIIQIVNGNMLYDGLAAGKDLDTIMKEYTSALSFFKSILPEDQFKELVGTAQANLATFLQDQFMGDDPVGNFVKLVDSTLGITPSMSSGSQSDIYMGGLPDGPQLSKLVDANDNVALHQLFDKTIDTMGTLLSTNPGWQDPAAIKGAFSTDAFRFAKDVLTKLESGELNAGNVDAYINSLVDAMPSTVGGAEYKEALKMGLKAIIEGTGITARTTATGGSFTPEEVAMILAQSTLKAGASLSRTTDWEANKGMLDHMFGSDGTWTPAGTYGWMATLAQTTDHSTFNDLLGKANRLVDATAATYVPAASTTPTTVPQTVVDKIAELIGPTLKIMAESMFEGNLPAQEQFFGNIMTAVTSLYSLAKPGGAAVTLADLMRDFVTKIEAPPGVDAPRYKAALVDAVSTILSGISMVWTAQGGPKRTGQGISFDELAYTIMYGSQMSGQFLKASGKFVSSFADAQKLIGENGRWTNYIKTMEGASEGLKAASKFVTMGAYVGWAALEWYWVAAEKDPGAKAILTIGAIADTVVAAGTIVEAVALVGQMLLPVEITAGATIALNLSRVFAVAGLVSTLAWIALVAYQDIRAEHEFRKLTDTMSGELDNLLDDTIQWKSGRAWAPEYADRTPW